MSFMITMSQRELHRLEVIQKIRDQRLGVVQTIELLGLSRSQVHRLLQAYDHSGAAGLVSKKRARPSNRRHSEEFRNGAGIGSVSEIWSSLVRSSPSSNTL